MQCCLIHCNGYKVLEVVTVNNFNELPELCRLWEGKTNDGYAVLARHNGEFVADADGLVEHWRPDPVYQAGMMYACGYRD